MPRLMDRSQPLTASDASQPRTGLSTDAGWKILRDHRRRLRDGVIAADGLALGTVQIPHPRLGTLDIYQWLLFVAAHEARHTAQVREAAAAVS
jgi:hypothetical protein